jgi:hypothetical protein
MTTTLGEIDSRGGGREKTDVLFTGRESGKKVDEVEACVVQLGGVMTLRVSKKYST